MYKSYRSLYNMCSNPTISETDNTKFLPLYEVTGCSDRFQEKVYPVLEKQNLNIKSDCQSCNSSPIKTCGDSKGECSVDGNKLYPLLDCRFNLREALKVFLLLEDHLSHKGKSCKQCILKHFLQIESFLEEGTTLSNGAEYSDMIEKLLARVREVEKGYI